jgi:signal transduction histidine kinase
MFIIGWFVHIYVKIDAGYDQCRRDGMGTVKAMVVHKHFRLDAVKLKRAQKLLDAPTETETVERAIDLAILEHERNRIANRAHDSFVRSKATVRDVYGVLE